jgi:hypothetical protein
VPAGDPLGSEPEQVDSLERIARAEHPADQSTLTAGAPPSRITLSGSQASR